jgi:asparagine synthase (glutamine-hydrolysing)
MFGLAIWDEKNKKLILARDPMGIKLLYFKVESDTLFFGSEIRPLLTLKKHEIDPIALNLFLNYRYTPSPFTIFKGINKLKPGTMLIAENGTINIKRWYNVKSAGFSSVPTDDQAKEELLFLYKRAVKRQLISDVPLGLLLSGGVDSGLLLSLMKLTGHSWPTYTVGYGESFRDDEISYANDTAKLFNVNNYSVLLDRNTFENTLTKIVSVLEEPIASSSIVPMYHVCARAKEDVKVALVGQGPDELFGGYKRHLGVYYGSYLRALPSFFRNPLKLFISRLPRNEALKRGIYSLDIPDRIRRFQNVFSLLPYGTIENLFKDDLLPPYSSDKILECWEDLYQAVDNSDELGGFQYLELYSSLPDELLMYSDKLSMAHGLEVRVPYLDLEIVHFVHKLPARFKIRNGSRKWLHKQVAKDFLPKEIIRRKKRGFAVNVVDEWFKKSLSGKIGNNLMHGDSLLYAYLNISRVHKLVKEHISGKNDNHKILFSLVLFEEWLRNYN